jgi:hypothetical protein
MTKQPTAQGISALLRNAGFERSKGAHKEGFVVNTYQDRVAVMYEQDVSAVGGVAAQVREHELLVAYTGVIEAAGFKVQQDQVGYALSLIVSAKEEA